MLHTDSSNEEGEDDSKTREVEVVESEDEDKTPASAVSFHSHSIGMKTNVQRTKWKEYSRDAGMPYAEEVATESDIKVRNC